MDKVDCEKDDIKRIEINRTFWELLTRGWVKDQSQSNIKNKVNKIKERIWRRKSVANSHYRKKKDDLPSLPIHTWFYDNY